jgi:hypothetical protein
MTAFSSSDTWVMLALLIGEAPDGASLRNIIATADYINHAIPQYEELAGGLARLMRAGYVEKRAGQFHATTVIRSFYTRTTKPRRSIWKDWQDVEHFLQTNEVTAPTGHVAPSRIVSRAAYERAVRAYTSSV